MPKLSAALLRLAHIGGEMAATAAVEYVERSGAPQPEGFSFDLERALRDECGGLARPALEAIRDLPREQRVDVYLELYRRAGIRAAKAALSGQS